MKHLPILGVLALAACSSTGGLTPGAASAVAIGCAVDGQWQPLAAAVLATVPGYGTAAASVDALLVHPLIVAACAKLGGAPAVAVVPAAPAAGGTVLVVPATLVPMKMRATQ